MDSPTRFWDLQLGQSAVWIGVLVETRAGKRTVSFALVEVPTRL